jgi:hypothetical protein
MIRLFVSYFKMDLKASKEEFTYCLTQSIVGSQFDLTEMLAMKIGVQKVVKEETYFSIYVS